MAHATPWERGSDAISNVFMRVMYKSLGIKSHPLKKGISLDMEAYCTELGDYKKRFPEFFENRRKSLNNYPFLGASRMRLTIYLRT